MSDHGSSNPSTPVSAVPPLPDVPPPVTRPYRFTWDPSRKGPRSVSETTEGRGDYIISQPAASLLNNVSSVNLSLGALPEQWSSSKHGFHAISTVLNNPHKRQAPPKAHSALPAVPPADLPRVRRKDFDSYIRAVAPEWDRFERNNQLGREGTAQIDGPSTPRASLSLDIPLSPTTPRTPRILPGKPIPPLNTVPPVFFETKFNLGDPRTFNSVTEQREGDEETLDPSALSHSLPLLEKMSHYADTIEQHLVREISLRSTSFFAALTNLQDLQTESEGCLDRISKLRGLLKDVDEKSAKCGLDVVRQENKLRNLGVVLQGVGAVSGYVEMTKVAKGLVAAGQWGEALNVIEEMEAVWDSDGEVGRSEVENGKDLKSLPSLPDARNKRLSPIPSSPDESEPRPRSPQSKKTPSTVPLSSLQAFSSLPSHLRTLTMEIASSLTSETVSVLRIDLTERISWNSGSDSRTYQSIDQSLRDRLRPLLHGLARTMGVKEAILSWREVVLDEVPGAIWKHLPSDLEDDDPKTRTEIGSSAGLANHLRNISHSQFMTLLRAIYRSLLNCIQGLQVQGGIIVDMLGSTQASTSFADMPALQEELSDILSSAAEFANTRAAQIVTFRAEQQASLDLPDFLGFFNESWDFVVKCEVICRRMIVGLRGIVVSQAKVFLQAFHQARITSSAKLVEDEQWNPSEITPSLQHIANVLIDSAVKDMPELLIDADLSPTTPSANGRTDSFSLGLSTPSEAQMPNGATPGSSKQLRIEERVYFAVSATCEVLVLLLDYLRVIVNLSMLTTDTMSRVIEFLKAFNSRTCQVVLGAGAMRSAGLKNITAKHLALASQSLSIMIALIPYVRETFRRHLSQKQAVMLVEFDKLKRDYQEHQNEIHAKLIAIMGDRLSAHIKSLQAVKWDEPKQGQGPSGYMDLLVKETVTLHKVLSRYLLLPVVEYVMTQVFAAINHRLSEEFTMIELPNQGGKERMLADARYLHQKFSALKNVGVLSTMLETVVSEKRVANEPKPPPLSPTPGISANQRIKGMLRKASGSPGIQVVEKALPIPTSNLSLSPSPVTSPFASTPSLNGQHNNGNGYVGNSSATPATPPPGAEGESRPGFKQVSLALEAADHPLPASPAPPPEGSGSPPAS